MINFYILIKSFITDIYRQRILLFDLSRRDLKIRFAGSFLGIFWAFIQPVITIFVLWFIVAYGFKSVYKNNVPFILWLITGMIPFNFFSDGLSQATTSIIENSFLVKKVVFKVSFLPIIKVISSLFIHLFFIVLLIIIFSIYGFSPSIYTLQLFYYLPALILLVLSISWATSAVTVFFRDLAQIVQTGLQLVFWGTPIFWSIDAMPEKLQWILKLNPLFYIVEGYRDCFINQRWFWHDCHLMLYFWGIVTIFLIIGITVFVKLRSHFADVL